MLAELRFWPHPHWCPTFLPVQYSGEPALTDHSAHGNCPQFQWIFQFQQAYK